MKTVLVTGCAGFIGSHLVERLLSEGYRVVGIDNFNDYYSPEVKAKNVSLFNSNPDFKLVIADITDKAALHAVFLKHDIKKVVHLASMAGVRNSLKFPDLYFNVNVVGTLNLLKLSVKHGVDQFVFASSSSVYGLNELPFKETQQINSMLSPYALTKRIGELFCEHYSGDGKLSVTCLRFFTVYGERGRPDMAVFKFTDLIERGQPIERFGSGGMKRDFTFVDDIVRGIMLSLENEFCFEIINLGSGFPVELNTLIGSIECNLGKKAKIVEKPVPLGDVPITFADVSKAERLLGWKPSTDFNDGIKRFVEWFKVRD